jgi:hypothetical protein
VRQRDVRRLLLSVRAEDEAEARRRSWAVVKAAYEEREPLPRSRRRWPALAATAAAGFALAAVVTAPGRALVNSIRDAIGREHVRGVRPAAPALFRLPAGGRLLVESPRGAWIVYADGSKRLLGRYRDATWSPHGRFVAAVRGHELVALDPRGGIRWTVDRAAAPRLPSWSPAGRVANDTRVAYISGHELRVVGGDGRGDRVLDRTLAVDAAPLQPAWRPGARHVVAYATRAGAVAVSDVDAIDAPTLRHRITGTPVDLAWSDDGSRLAVASKTGILVLDPRARLVSRRRTPSGARITAIAFVPGTHVLTEVLRQRVRSTLSAVGGASLFAGPGRFTAVAWSPDARWVLVAWPSAEQWLFIPRAGRRVRSVANIPLQFHSPVNGPFPAVAARGWCCSGG